MESFGREQLNPDSILMTNNRGMTVEMNDSEGITISSASASLLFAAGDSLQVKQSGTSMTMDEDIHFTGGEFRIQ